MFGNPNDVTPQLEEGRYILKLKALEATKPHPEYGPGIRWIFLVFEPAGGPITRDDGSPMEFWQQTSTKITPKARARPWVEALLGRPLTTDDTGEDLPDLLPGRRAIALIATNEKGYSDIVKLSPMKAPATAAKPGAQAATAVAEREPDLAATDTEDFAF